MNKSFRGAGLYLPLFLFIFIIFFISYSFSSVNDVWQFITLSEDGKYEIYINKTSIKKLNQNEVYAEVKLYPSQAERDKIKKEFEELERQVQQEFGTKVNHTEKLLYEMYSLKSHYFQYKAICNKKKIEVLGTGFIKFFIEVKPNSPAEKVYNYLCKFNK